MSTFYETPIRSEELYHHGVLGMKWGVHKAKKTYASMTPKQQARMDKKAARIVKRNTKLSKKMRKNDVMYKDNKGAKAVAITNAAAFGIAGLVLAPTPATKAAIASTSVTTIGSIVSGRYNKPMQRKLNKGQNWLKENGYKVSESDKELNVYSFADGKSYGMGKYKQYKLEGRRRK